MGELLDDLKLSGANKHGISVRNRIKGKIEREITTCEDQLEVLTSRYNQSSNLKIMQQLTKESGNLLVQSTKLRELCDTIPEQPIKNEESFTDTKPEKDESETTLIFQGYDDSPIPVEIPLAQSPPIKSRNDDSSSSSNNEHINWAENKINRILSEGKFSFSPSSQELKPKIKILNKMTKEDRIKMFKKVEVSPDVNGNKESLLTKSLKEGTNLSPL